MSTAHSVCVNRILATWDTAQFKFDLAIGRNAFLGLCQGLGHFAFLAAIQIILQLSLSHGL